MAAGAIVKATGSAIKATKFLGKGKSANAASKITTTQKTAKIPNSNSFKVNKKSTVAASNFLSGFSESINQSEKNETSKSSDSILKIVQSIEKKIIKIDLLLKNKFEFDKKNQSQNKRQEEKERYGKREEKIENPKKEDPKKISFKSFGGGSFFDSIKRFIFWTLFGWIFPKISPLIPSLIKVFGKAMQAAYFAMEVFGGIANVLTKFLAGGIRLVNGLTKTLAVVSGARTDKEIEEFEKKFNRMIDLTILAAMLAGDAGFNVLDLFKKGKGPKPSGGGRVAKIGEGFKKVSQKVSGSKLGKTKAGRVVSKVTEGTGSLLRRGGGRSLQRLAIKIGGKRGGEIVKGVSGLGKGIAGAAGSVGGGIFKRGVGRVATRGGIAVAGKTGGQFVKGAGSFLGKAAGPIATIAMAGFDFANRKSQGQTNLQAGAGVSSAVAGAAAGAAIGSIIPGLGTVVGGLIGGAIGAWGASKIADKLTGADKVQPKESTIPQTGYSNGGIIHGFVRGGIIKPSKEKPQETNAGKDVGGYKEITNLFPDPTGEGRNSGSSNPSTQTGSSWQWWNPFSWFSSTKNDNNKQENKQETPKPPSGASALKSLKDTSKTFKKIPFVGELMGIAVDISMGQKPDKPFYKRIAKSVIYLAQKLSVTKNLNSISDVSQDIQQLSIGGVATTVNQDFLNVRFTEKSIEEMTGSLSSMIEKGANDALTDIRKEILTAKTRSSIRSTISGDSGSGSESGGGESGTTPSGGGESGTTPSGGGESGTTPSGGGGGGLGGLTPNAKALLETIKWAEGTVGANAYNTWFGGSQYGGDLSKKTIAQVVELQKRFLAEGRGNFSGGKSAAVGAYQMIYPDTFAKRAGYDINKTYFTPQVQDKLAIVGYMKGQAKLSDAEINGPISRQLIAKISGVWASLPNMSGQSAYGQPVKKYSDLEAKYKSYLGQARQQASTQAQTPTRSPDNRPTTAPTGTPAGRVIPGGSLSFIGHGDGATGKLFLKDASGKNIGSWEAISGVFRTANASQEERRNVSGTLNPLPDGNYPLLNFAKHSYMDGIGVWSTYINNSTGSIGRRSQLLVHNDIGSNGTAGCVGVELGGTSGTQAEKRFLELYQQVQPKSIKVAIGKGANRGGGSKPRSSADNSNSKARPAFHGDSGFVNKDNETLQLHKGEFFNVVDKDSVNLFGKDFFETLNNVENKTQLSKVAPDLIGRINSIVHGKNEKITQDSFAINSIFSTNQKLEDEFDKISTKNLEKFNKQQETKTEESQQKEDENEDNKKQRVQVIAASHPQTGSGFTIKGVTDGNGRPLILSKGGIRAFGEMMLDSKGVVKGTDVASGKRSESHNRKVGGVPNSNHLGGNALDIHGGSQSWMRKHGKAYGWIINDYPGSHGGHFDYKGKDDDTGGDTFAARSADITTDSVTDFAPSGGGGGSYGGGGGSRPYAGRDDMIQRNIRQIDAEPSEPLVPGGPRPKGGKFRPAAPMSGGAVSVDEKLFKELGASAEDWDIFRNTIAHIESKGAYDIAGGSGGHYDGRYQMGAAAKTDAARILGISDPGHSPAARSAYRNNPELQEKMFAAFTIANHRYLMRNPEYKNASVERKLQILGYAHNQGMGGAERWLKTGEVGADGFGTKGTAYTDALAANFKARDKAIKDGTYGKEEDSKKPGNRFADPDDIEKDQQIAGANTKGRYGRLGVPNTDGQDTGADIELFGKRGEISKTFGDNAKEGPYGNRGVEISFPYDLIYLERVPGGRNKGHKSIDVQGSTTRDYKAVTGSTGFGHVGSYYYKDPKTGKMFEVMMGHGNKPFRKFKEGEVIKAGTVVGWQGASGSSDSMQGGVYDHVTFHVNAVDGGDPGPIFDKFANSLLSGQGAKLTAELREKKLRERREQEISKKPELLTKDLNQNIINDLKKKDIVLRGNKFYRKGGGLFGMDMEIKVDKNTNSWIYKMVTGSDAVSSISQKPKEVKKEQESAKTGSVSLTPSKSKGEYDLIIPLDHVRPENARSVPDTKGGSTFNNAAATGAAGRERDHQDKAAAALQKRLEKMGYKVRVITPEEFGNYEDYDNFIMKSADKKIPIMPLHFDAARDGGGKGFLTRVKSGDLDDSKLAEPIQNALAMFQKENKNLGDLGPTDSVGNATLNRASKSAATLVELGVMVDWEKNFGPDFTSSAKFGGLLDSLAGAISKGIGAPRNKPVTSPIATSRPAASKTQRSTQKKPKENKNWISKTASAVGGFFNNLMGKNPKSKGRTKSDARVASKSKKGPAKAEGGGQIGKSNISQKSINNFASYEDPFNSNMTLLYQERIKYIKIPDKSKRNAGGLSMTSSTNSINNSYYLRRN